MFLLYFVRELCWTFGIWTVCFRLTGYLCALHKGITAVETEMLRVGRLGGATWILIFGSFLQSERQKDLDILLAQVLLFTLMFNIIISF